MERQNHRELTRFEKTSIAELRRLERRLAATEKNLAAQGNADLGRLGQQLRAELATLETSLRGADSTTLANIDAIVTRVQALEVKLGPELRSAQEAAPPPTPG